MKAVYSRKELQEVIDALIVMMPDIARQDLDVLPVLEAVRVLTEVKTTNQEEAH